MGAAQAEILSGPIRVVDADTIDIGADTNIRLLGIDAAEGAQTCREKTGGVLPCGAMATEAVRRLYAGAMARCDSSERDRYGRRLATCTIGGVDLGADLMSRGLARRYRDDPRYAEEEKAAILLERGLWAYDMVDPAVWRAEQRRRVTTGPTATGPAGCPIKGNISANGRLYHMPGSFAYDRTRINLQRGERWFCSEAEARAAGWRRAGG